MQHPYQGPLADLFSFLYPEMLLIACACAMFLGGLFRSDKKLWSGVALAALFGAFGLHLMIVMGPASHRLEVTPSAVFGVPLLFDSLAFWTRVLALATGGLFILLAWSEVPERQTADHHACLLIIIAGVSLVGAANDLVTLFLALEMISIPTYVMLYLPRHDDDAQEASIKYFLLSVFSSALMLFGFSYLFGLAGTTNIAAILEVLYAARPEETAAASGLAQVAMLTIAAGIGFRITAVPFHFYAPDVFQGTSTSGAAFLSYVPKIAGFVAILRVFGFIVPEGVALQAHQGIGLALSNQVPTLFWFLAALTMTVGNLLALLQDNLKRLLAYSSIAHAGYMLVAVASAPYLSGPEVPTSGVTALLFYLIAYGAMTFGAFGVIVMLDRKERPVENVDDLAGLAKSHPVIALLVTILMLSFIGIPLTAGFTGKFLIFLGALFTEALPAAGGTVKELPRWLYPTLAVIGMLNAAIGGWYYLRIITVMYLRSAIKPIATPGTIPGLATLGICVALTLGLSVPPTVNWILGAARHTTERNPPPAPPPPVAVED
jgi:NADH-quinone oxidoreductase subunit N